jgi:hypothetical protein
MEFKQIFLSVSLVWFFGIAGISQTPTGKETGTFEGEVVHPIAHEELELYHSPKKATILSAVLPGAGQIYNNKWWKAPIVWIGMGTALYLSQDYRTEYQFWKDQYVRRVNPDQTDDYPNASTPSLENQMVTYKQWMETSYIVMGAIYVLQILDANVDAHLMSFDVSDDLSLNIRPDAQWNMALNKPTCGLTLKLAFK